MKGKSQRPAHEMRDGPWPRVSVAGDLEQAEAEWLSANSLGAYSMSTVALMHTRRQHGLLVSPLAEDFRRHVVLSHLEMNIVVAGRNYSLSTHQFPNMAPTLGYRSLETFTQDPLPRWVYRLPSGTIERTVSLVDDRQAVVIALTWSGKETARLTLRPLMPMRPANELSREHGGMLQKVTLRSGEVEVQPLEEFSKVHFRHSGVFMGFPDWWRKFEYLDDRGRYESFQEDMWSPGLFEFQMEPRLTQYLLVSVGEPPEAQARELVMEAAQRRLATDPAHEQTSELGSIDVDDPLLRTLCVAAESFVFGDGTAILAGYPWLDVWSRDTLLAVPGVFLARDQVERAQRALRHLLRNMQDGLLVNRTTVPEEDRMPCLDASLWLFPIGLQVAGRSAENLEFSDELYQGLLSVFDRVTSPERKICWLTDDGLLVGRAEFPLTWMEACLGGRACTPRQGLAVELQALWVLACRLLADQAEQRADPELADEARGRADAAVAAFRQMFWCHEINHPFDCMSEERQSADAWADPSVRPNALIALSVCPELFETWQADEILARTDERLLTSRGIRTLEPMHPDYIGYVGDTVEEHQASSHQGSAWMHLLLFYVRASLRRDPGRGPQLRKLVENSLLGPRALGHVWQLVDGDPPHRVRGIPAYAIATGMILEALAVDLAAPSQEA